MNAYWKLVRPGMLVPRSANRTRFAFNHLTSGGTTIPNTVGTENSWRDVNLADGAHWAGNDPNLPAEILDAIKYIRCDGLFIVTHHGVSGIADLQFSWRVNNSDPFNSGNYQAQAIEATSSAGVRQTASLGFAVEDHRFQIRWLRAHPSDTTFSAGFNFKLTEVYF